MDNGPIQLPADYTNLDWMQRRAVRNEYVKVQDGKCCHCDGRLDVGPPVSITHKEINWGKFPPNFLKYPIHLHHCHETGQTIGAVHSYCNAVLWQYHGE